MCTTYVDPVYFRIFGRDGAPLGDRFEAEADADTSARPSVVWNGASFVVAYPAGGSWIEVRAEDGSEVSSERIPSHSGPFDLAYTGTHYAISLVRSDDWYFTHGMLGAFPSTETALARLERPGRPVLAWTGHGYVTAVLSRVRGMVNSDLAMQVLAIDPMGVARTALPIALSTSAGPGGFNNDRAPGIAGAPSQALVAWEDHRDGNADIYFARIASDGDVIQPATPVAATPDSSVMGAAAFAGDGFGVVWSDAGDLYFARVACPP